MKRTATIFCFLFYVWDTLSFPKELRKYHGAEHKVFSFKGIISISNANIIKQAEITNRYCSTNFVVVYFSLVIIGTIIVFFMAPFDKAIELASYGSLLLAPIINSQLNRNQ
ncbi:DUF1385 domain-containing protein [Anaerobacillus sp. HL2]|nr:DUF1385 domain-containing protein [Anaerobacillus sp. HL2]